MRSGAARAVVAAAATALAALVVSPLGGARVAAPLTLTVTFSANGGITLATPDGTAVGATSGTPTSIPAGYYVIQMFGPGGCAVLPHFILHGPGVQLDDNMTEGEVNTASYNVFLQPNSTYVWNNDAVPGVSHTFVTGPTVQGTPPASAGPGGLSSSNHTTVSSSDLIGSGVLPYRGTLTVTVDPAGRLKLTFDGKVVSSLKAGRYTVTVTDRSKTTGLALRKAQRTIPISSAKFVGKHSASVSLTAGRWSAVLGAGKSSYSILVD